MRSNTVHVFRLAQLASTGYIPSSVYLRSSYRTKQYPTLSNAAAASSAGIPATSRHHHQHALNPLFQQQHQQHHQQQQHFLRPQSSSSANVDAVDAGGRSATLPSSPFRNKYEAHLTQCDSPVGLYNCPQQRTSQAFSSMDDLDAMVSAAGSIASSTSHLPTQQQGLASAGAKHMQQQQPFPIVRLEAAAAATSGGAPANSYPSLERSITRGGRPPPSYNPKMANRELPALPTTNQSGPPPPPLPPPVGIKPLKTAELARSMEDLDVLEAAGIRGRSKMNYREVSATPAVVNGGDSISLADAMLNKLNMAHRQSHHLRNTDEYPAHHSPASTSAGGANPTAAANATAAAAAAAAAAVGSHNMLGIRPLETGGPYPTPLTSATLLPGQTYPDPVVATSSISSLQDVLYNHHQLQQHHNHTRQTSTVSAVVAGSKPAAAAQPPGAAPVSSDDAPPPLFPKQYYQVVEQRRRSGLDPVPVPPRSLVSESPAVNRKVKPLMSTPPAPTTPASSSSSNPPPLPPTPSSSVKLQMLQQQQQQLNESFENVPSTSSSNNAPEGGGESSPAKLPPSKLAPYHRESSKPFEMADFYKYSTKFRKTSSSSVKDEVSGESASNSPRSSTASGGSSSQQQQQPQPPEIPARSQPPASHGGGKDLGEDFTNEMLAWYNNKAGDAAGGEKQPASGGSSSSSSAPGKPATLV